MPPDIPVHTEVVAFAQPPSRQKTTIYFSTSPLHPGEVGVQFNLCLDPTIPEEAAAHANFGADPPVDYWADVDLETERERITALVNNLFVDGTTTAGIIRRLPLAPLGDKDVSTCFSKIAEYGASVYYRLFWELRKLDQGSDEKQNETLRQAIRSFLKRRQILCLAAEVPLFPWAFLFADVKYQSSGGAPDLRQFWGFRHEIQEQLRGTATSLHLSAKPKIAKAICSKLDSGNWHADPSHPLNTCSSTSSIATATDLGQRLANFQEEGLYIFAHAFQKSPPDAQSSYLRLNGDSLSVDELCRKYRAPNFGPDVVVGFLNGCSTAPPQLWNEASITGYLCLRGHNRLCCVATTANLPAAFGAEFAREFWQNFICKKDPISKALLDARVAMLDRYNNPLGLMFSLYGRADTQCG
jgi:hypothetical protein